MGATKSRPVIGRCALLEIPALGSHSHGPAPRFAGGGQARVEPRGLGVTRGHSGNKEGGGKGTPQTGGVEPDISEIELRERLMPEAYPIQSPEPRCLMSRLHGEPNMVSFSGFELLSVHGDVSCGRGPYPVMVYDSRRK